MGISVPIITFLFAGATVTAVISAIVGFGGGLSLFALMALVLDFALLIPVYGAVQFTSATSRVWFFRKDIVFPLFGWFLLAFLLLPIWSAFHFYWVHRLLHVPLLYRKVHSLHHRNVNIGPWSGLSMHPVEHFLYLSSLCIHWFVASHPIHLIFHIIYQGPGAAITHTGYEDLLIKDKRRLALGTFYHQLHHRYYECNYGNQEMPWDRWFGTFNDGTDEATRLTRERKKKMYQ